MKIFSEALKKIGIRVAIFVTLLCVCLFLLLSYLVFDRGQRAFDDVITVTFGEEDQYHFNGATWIPVEGRPMPSPIEAFKLRFQNSVFWVTIIGICGAFLIGILTSYYMTKPISRLHDGFQKLRKSNYKSRIKATGTEEFDSLIEEFNRLASELERVEDLRKDLISDTSHELKTPITSLVGQLEGIRDGVIGMDDKRISTLLDQVHRLNDLVEQLQEFSRLRGRTLKLKKEKLKLKKLVNTVISRYEEDIKVEKIKITIDILENETVEGEKALLEQVFTNLLQNALRYSHANNIIIAKRNRNIIFKDDGVGIDNNHLPYIFERFYRVEKSRNRKTGGLGLGLSIVKEIIEAHGWSISASSEQKGVEFMIKM